MGFIPLSLFKVPQGKWPEATQIRIGKEDCKEGPVFDVKVAQSAGDRAKGLSHRKKPLAPSEGMLFILTQNTSGYFWMKDTYIPLALIFFDNNGKVLSGVEMPVEQNPEAPIHEYNIPKGTSYGLEIAPGNSTQFISPSAYSLCIKTF